MAELIDATPAPTVSSCGTPEAQETCCEPSDKAACCDTSAAGGSCGCAAGQTTVREQVRERYAAAARSSGGALITDDQAAIFGAGLYGSERNELPDTALTASLGCGN